MTDEPIQSNFFRPRVMGRFIERLTGMSIPFRIAAPTHPILRLELKGIRWLQPDARARLHRMIGRRIRWTIIFVLLLVILDLLRAVQNLRQGRNYYYSGQMPSNYMLVGALLFSVLMFAVGDFYYLIRSLKSITPERESGHWDMIRLVPMSPKVVLDAKYAALQIQSWRVLMMEYVPRFYLMIALIPNVIVSNISVSYYYYSSSYYSLSWLNTILSTAMAALMIFIYTLEAGWRMRALTAIGLAISARSRNLVTNFIYGFLALIGVHMLEILCLFVPFYLFARVSRYLPYYNSIGYYVRINAPAFLMIVIIGVLNFALFFSLRRIAYNYALRRAFRDV